MTRDRFSEPDPEPKRVSDMVIQPAATLSTAQSADATLRPAFTAFYRDTYGDVARALSMTLGDADLAKEATDEAMVRCYARWRVVAGYDNPAGWVYRVGLNWATSVRRKLSRRWRTPMERPEPTTFQVSDPVVEEALADLEMEMRAVVVCRIMLDWSVEETASALGIPAGTVKSRLSRALERLERRLYDYREER